MYTNLNSSTALARRTEWEAAGPVDVFGAVTRYADNTSVVITIERRGASSSHHLSLAQCRALIRCLTAQCHAAESGLQSDTQSAPVML